VNPETQIPQLSRAPMSEMAGDLRAAAQKASQERLVALPYNHYDPDNTTWWLLNSSEMPAYRFGKLIVTKDPAVVGPGDRFIGLHVEKGVHGDIAAATFTMYHRDSMVMDSTWRWPQLVRAFRSGRFADEATTAETSAGLPLTVTLIAGLQLADKEKPEHQSQDSDADVARFICVAGQLTPIEGVRRQGRLDSLAKATSFSAIAEAVPAIREEEFVWIEFLIGVQFGLTEDGGSQAWSPQDVWDRVYRPWQSWIDVSGQ
jgi:hypothetical protein